MRAFSGTLFSARVACDAEVVHLGQPRVDEAMEEGKLALERGEIVWGTMRKNLQRDRSREQRILSEIRGARTALAEDALDAIPPSEDLGRSENHRDECIASET